LPTSPPTPIPSTYRTKKHLHWKALESISSMNNKIEFAAPTHILLLGSGRGENVKRMSSSQ
jgi:hypothetical protein